MLKTIKKQTKKTCN